MTDTAIFSTPPVLFLVFNRPDKTRQVMAAIRKARPIKRNCSG